jgi:hypothetical protein
VNALKAWARDTLRGIPAVAQAVLPMLGLVAALSVVYALIA